MFAQTQFEPPYCPLHGTWTPCMYCLIPEVMDKINKAGHARQIDFFQTVDRNIN